MGNKPWEYVLLANREAMELFKNSEETLLESNNFDFMVYRFTNRSEMLKNLTEWDDFIPISESSYNLLHSNLCKKLRDNFHKHMVV